MIGASKRVPWVGPLLGAVVVAMVLPGCAFPPQDTSIPDDAMQAKDGRVTWNLTNSPGLSVIQIDLAPHASATIRAEARFEFSGLDRGERRPAFCGVVGIAGFSSFLPFSLSASDMQPPVGYQLGGTGVSASVAGTEVSQYAATTGTGGTWKHLVMVSPEAERTMFLVLGESDSSVGLESLEVTIDSDKAIRWSHVGDGTANCLDHEPTEEGAELAAAGFLVRQGSSFGRPAAPWQAYAVDISASSRESPVVRIQAGTNVLLEARGDSSACWEGALANPATVSIEAMGDEQSNRVRILEMQADRPIAPSGWCAP